MNPIRSLFDRLEPTFGKDGKLKVFYPLYEAIETFFFTPREPTTGTTHVRDTLDYKRLMMTVVIALIPCTLMAMYNTGLQANQVMESMGISTASGWRGAVMGILQLGYDPDSLLSCFVHGALYFLPAYLVCMVVGGSWEVLFAIVRGHEVNEGFFVTGLLFPLILPPTIPLWQVAVGITFGVVLGKEIFGGTGRNFLNPALTARAYLFFAHAGDISGNSVWTAVDGYSAPTPLSIAMDPAQSGVREVSQAGYSWLEAFFGFIPGSMGETSTLACLIGLAILLVTGVASWRIMLSMTVAAFAMAGLFNLIGSETNAAFEVGPLWHFVLGGFAFGMVFMATDPVSAAMTRTGQYIYGALIGLLVLIVRVVNPAYPEGTMLAILFGNMAAPLIDYYVVKAFIQRRAVRMAAS